MLYVVTYSINALAGPAGFVSLNRREVIHHAAAMAHIALDHLDDAVNSVDWTDQEGARSDPRKLLRSNDVEEVTNVVMQISEKLKLEDEGYIDLHEHHDLFELVRAHEVESRCGMELKARIADARKAYFGVVHELAYHWPDD